MAGLRPRLHANLAALRTLRQIQSQARPATTQEQQVLARWSGWGAIAQQAFSASHAAEYAAEQAELRSLLDKDEYAAAKRSTLNAHYTDAALVQAMWGALRDLGVQGGNVLEPGCGSGNFVGFAPSGVHMTGVELDSTTAAIASLLYPDARVRNESFVETLAPQGVFDAVVGNVPFGDHKLYDPEYNADRSLSIHNHFIVKSLDLTKPGGVVAVVTSHHTMDNETEEVRARIATQADVLGVVRLPSSAHQEAAGTKVVTDIMVLRKRSAGEQSAHLAPITDGVRDVAAQDAAVDVPVHVNTYFDAHPEHVLGKVGWRSGQFGPELEVHGPAEGLAERVRAALGDIVARAEEAGLGAVPAPAGTPRLNLAEVGQGRYEGLIQVDERGQLTRMRRGMPEEYSPKQERQELIALVRLRDTVLELMDSEQATRVETPHITELRRRLNTQYDAYVDTYGHINRRRVDKNGVASRPSQGMFRFDPLAAYVFGLEEYDTDTHTAIKTKVFFSRVLNPPVAVERAENPRDALYTSLRESGAVDLDRVASLLGLSSTGRARAALGELVFDDPATGELVSAPAYLSGNVRLKLRQARQAAESDPELRVNVRALEKVQRPELTAAEILPQLGAAWIPDEVVQQFAREVLENDEIEVVYTGEGKWWVSDHGENSHQARTVYGTKHQRANELLATALNMKSVQVRTQDEDGRRHVDLKASANAEAKMQALRERFNTWLWQDPARTSELVERYNEQFNSLRLRSYDEEVRLDRVFPGVDAGFEPRPHQIAAVERVLAEDAVLLAHSTGAGKTSEIIMAAMEARRLGQANKPAIVVPNNVIEQFAGEFRQRYPNARILVADKQKMGSQYRQEFLSQVAMGDWDAVIFTHEQFEKIPMNPETRRRRLTEDYNRLQTRFERLEGDSVVSKATIKQAERAAIKAEQRLIRHLENAKDPGITFEHTGIDMVALDEAHKYKNLSVISNIVDAAKVSSNRADDMLMKFDHVREGGGKLVMATATPLANSMSEMWVFTRFLNPSWLAERDMMDFDRWAATFGVLQSMPETDEANQLVMRTRFAKFRNVPELVLAWSQFCDTKTKKMLNLPEPAVAWFDEHGARHEGARSLLVPPTPEQLDYQLKIIEPRMEAFRLGSPWVMGHRIDEATGKSYEVKDMTLWIGNHAQANSVDRRLAPHPPQITPLAMEDLHRSLAEMERFNALKSEDREARMQEYQQLLQHRSRGAVDDADLPEWFNAMSLGLTKTDVAANLLFEVWDKNKDRVFLDRITKQPHPRPGALQLVFCDSGVWNKDKAREGVQYTVYEDLRERLVAMGIPREQIRFLQEAGDDDRKKAQIFEACRDGRVSVLIGSTEGMGVGTNVQDRAVHLLHMDCPWRPCDIEQREGRIERQGNQSDEIQITRLTTANSYDAKKWSTNARKAGFIGQIMRGEVTEREIDDIDPQQADFGMTAGLAANSPRQQAYAVASQKLSMVEMEYQNWQSSQATSRQVLKWIPHRITEADAFLSELDAVLDKRVSTRGDDFRLQVGEQVLDKRKDAGTALKAVIARAMDAHPRDETVTVHPVGRLGGLEFSASIGYDSYARRMWAVLSFDDLPGRNSLTGLVTNRVALGTREDVLGANPLSVCQSLERVLNQVESLRADYATYRQAQVDSERQAMAHLEMGFAHSELREELRQEVARLEEELGISRQESEIAEPGETDDIAVVADVDPGVGARSAPRGKVTAVEPSPGRPAGGGGASSGTGSGAGASAARGSGHAAEQPGTDVVRDAQAAINELYESTPKKRPQLRARVQVRILNAIKAGTDAAMIGSLLASAHMSDTSGPWDKPDQLAKLGLLPDPEAGEAAPTAAAPTQQSATPVRDRAGGEKDVPPGQGEEVLSVLGRARKALEEQHQSYRMGNREARLEAATKVRVRLKDLTHAVELGEEDREAALEVFASFNRANPEAAYAMEPWRERIAVPSTHSPHFDQALILLHDRDQSTVQVPPHLVEDLQGLLYRRGFEPGETNLLWSLPTDLTKVREEKLGLFLRDLDEHAGVERMRTAHYERLRERALSGREGADQGWEQTDADLRERVHHLLADNNLHQAWEEIAARVAELRSAEDPLPEAELAELPVGRLRSQVLIQARRNERALDQETGKRAELSPDQREELARRYRRSCPHLDEDQIRVRLEASADQITVLRNAYAAVENLGGGFGHTLRSGRWQVEGLAKEVAKTLGAEPARQVLAAANEIDPAHAWARESLRTQWALENQDDTAEPPLLAFSDHGNTFRVYVSVHTPQPVRRLLAEHGWHGMGGPLDPWLTLETDTDSDLQAQREAGLASTLMALDALDEPVSRVNVFHWLQKRDRVQEYAALVQQEPQLREQVNALMGSDEVRRAVHLVLEHLELRRSTARVEETFNEEPFALHLDLMATGFRNEAELNDELAALSAHDEDARYHLAGAYWQKCPHLTLEQIAARVGHDVADLVPAGEHGLMYALEQGGARERATAPVRDVFTPVREAIEQLRALQGGAPRSAQRFNLNQARVGFDNTLAAVEAEPGIDRGGVAEMFVLANRADPGGAWKREEMRSVALYPVERYDEGAPILEVREGRPVTVRLLVEADQVPAALWNTLEELKFSQRRSDSSGMYSLPGNLGSDKAADRLNALVAACDEAGVGLITHAQNEERRRARDNAAWQARQERLAVVEARTPQVRASVTALREGGRLRDAVEAIEAHWTELELMGQREWQGLGDAKKHELWPLRQELMDQGKEHHAALKEEYGKADLAGQVEGVRRMLVECPHLRRSEIETALAQGEEKLARQRMEQDPPAPVEAESSQETPPVLLSREPGPRTPVSLELDSAEAEQDRALVAELTSSWAHWRSGERTGAEHERVRAQVRLEVQARLDQGRWGPAWRLLQGARCVDPQGVSAYTSLDADRHEEMRELAWHVLADGPGDPDMERLAFEAADQALSAPGVPAVGYRTPFRTTLLKLMHAGLWQSADELITLGRARGADTSQASEQLRGQMLEGLLRVPADNQLLPQPQPPAPVWARAFGRLGTSTVYERETKDRNRDAVSSHRGALFTSELFTLWANNHGTAALALIEHANHRDPARAWHHEELRSRMLFSALPQAANLVRIVHTEAGTHVLGLEDRAGIAWDSPAGQALKEAKFSKGRRNDAKHLWYLNSTTSLEVRTVRVGQLISLLDRSGVPHITESRFQALAADADAAVNQDVSLKEMIVQAHREVEELAGQAQHKSALQAIRKHLEFGQLMPSVNSQEAFGLSGVREDIMEEARALGGKARLRYQKAKREGARPSELLRLLEDFTGQHPQGEDVRDVRSLRTSLEGRVRDGDLPLRSEVAVESAPEPARTPHQDAPEREGAPMVARAESPPAPQPEHAAQAPSPEHLRERTRELLEALDGPERVRTRGPLLQHMTEIERLRGTAPALQVMREANRIDPQGRLERERHRSAMVLSELEHTELPRVMVFDTDQMDTAGLVHLAMPENAPAQVLDELARLGWRNTGAGFTNRSLYQSDLGQGEQLADRLAQTWQALEELVPEPEFALAQVWEQQAEPLRRVVEAALSARIQELHAHGRLDYVREAPLFSRNLEMLRLNGTLDEGWQAFFGSSVREVVYAEFGGAVQLTRNQLHCTYLGAALEMELPPQESTAAARSRQVLAHLEKATVERDWLRDRLLGLLPQAAAELSPEGFYRLVKDANQADPHGRWEREKVRSIVLFPNDHEQSDWPVIPRFVVDPYSAFPLRSPYPVDDSLAILSTPPLVKQVGPTWTQYALDRPVPPGQQRELVEEVMRQLEELGVPVITNEQHAAWQEHQRTAPATQLRTKQGEQLAQRAHTAAEALADAATPTARTAARELAGQVRASAASDRALSVLDLANRHDPAGAWEREEDRSQWALPTSAALGFTAAVVVDHTDRHTRVYVPSAVGSDVRRRLEELHFTAGQDHGRLGPQTGAGMLALPARLDLEERTALVGQALAYLGEVDQPRMTYAHWRRRHEIGQSLPISSVRGQDRAEAADARNHPSYRRADLAAYRWSSHPAADVEERFTAAVRRLLTDTTPATALDLVSRVEQAGLPLPQEMMRLRDELSTPLQVDLHLVATGGTYPGQVDLLRDPSASQVRLSRATMEQLDVDLASHVTNWPAEGPFPTFVLSRNEHSDGYLLHQLGDQAQQGVRLDPDEQDMFVLDRAWGGVALREPHPAGDRLDWPGRDDENLHRLLATPQIARLDVPPVVAQELLSPPEEPVARAAFWLTSSNKVSELVEQGSHSEAVRVLDSLGEACRTPGEYELWARHHRALALALKRPQQVIASDDFASKIRADLHARYLLAWHTQQPKQQSARMLERAGERMLDAVVAAPDDLQLFWRGRSLSQNTRAWDDAHEHMRLRRPLPEDVVERMRERGITLPYANAEHTPAFPIEEKDLALPGEQVPLDAATVRARRAWAHQVALTAWQDLDALDRLMERSPYRTSPFTGSEVRSSEASSPAAPWAGRPSVDDRVFVYTWARRTRADLAPPTVEQALAEARSLRLDNHPEAARKWLHAYSDLTAGYEYARAGLPELGREETRALDEAFSREAGGAEHLQAHAQRAFDHYWQRGEFTKAAAEMDLGGRELFLTDLERSGVVAQRYWAEFQATVPVAQGLFDAGELHQAATAIDDFHHRWSGLDHLNSQVKHHGAKVGDSQALLSLRYEIQAEVSERSGRRLRSQIAQAYSEGETAHAARLYADYERMAGPDSLASYSPFTDEVAQELRQFAAAVPSADASPEPAAPAAEQSLSTNPTSASQDDQAADSRIREAIAALDARVTTPGADFSAERAQLLHALEETGPALDSWFVEELFAQANAVDPVGAWEREAARARILYTDPGESEVARALVFDHTADHTTVSGTFRADSATTQALARFGFSPAEHAHVLRLPAEWPLARREQTLGLALAALDTVGLRPHPRMPLAHAEHLNRAGLEHQAQELNGRREEVLAEARSLTGKGDFRAAERRLREHMEDAYRLNAAELGAEDEHPVEQARQRLLEVSAQRVQTLAERLPKLEGPEHEGGRARLARQLWNQCAHLDVEGLLYVLMPSWQDQEGVRGALPHLEEVARALDASDFPRARRARSQLTAQMSALVQAEDHQAVVVLSRMANAIDPLGRAERQTPRDRSLAATGQVPPEAVRMVFTDARALRVEGVGDGPEHEDARMVLATHDMVPLGQGRWRPSAELHFPTRPSIRLSMLYRRLTEDFETHEVPFVSAQVAKQYDLDNAEQAAAPGQEPSARAAASPPAAAASAPAPEPAAEMPSWVAEPLAGAEHTLTALRGTARLHSRERVQLRRALNDHLGTLVYYRRFSEVMDLVGRADDPALDSAHALDRLTLHSLAAAGMDTALPERAVHLDHDPVGRTRVHNVPEDPQLQRVLRANKFAPAKDEQSGVWQLQDWKEPTRLKWARAALSELRLDGHSVISREAYRLLDEEPREQRRANHALDRLKADPQDPQARQELTQALQEWVETDPAASQRVGGLCNQADNADPEGWPTRMHVRGLARFAHDPEALRGAVRIDYDGVSTSSLVRLPAEGDFQAAVDILRGRPFGYAYDEQAQGWSASRPRVKAHTYRARMLELIGELETEGLLVVSESAHQALAATAQAAPGAGEPDSAASVRSAHELTTASAPAVEPTAPAGTTEAADTNPTNGTAAPEQLIGSQPAEASTAPEQDSRVGPPPPKAPEPEMVPAPEVVTTPMTISSTGHVGEPFDVLRLPTAQVHRIREFPPRKPGDPSTWMVVYRTDNSRELVAYLDQDPGLAEGQRVQDLLLKVSRHTWWTPKRGPNAGKPQPRTEVEVVTPPTGERHAPTPEQQAIITAASQRKKLGIIAGAGTGKTTTMTLVAEKLAADGRKGTLVVFGRANALDAGRKLAHVPVQVATMHALARRAVGRPFERRLQGEATPDWDVVARRLGLKTLVLADKKVLEARGLARLLNRAVETFELSADTTIGVQHIKRPPGMNDQAFKLVQRALEPHLSRAWDDMCDPHGTLLRFRHDTYVKLWHLSGARITVGDFLVIDEAQDMSQIFQAILQDQTHMQQLHVGDPHQAIFAFRGPGKALENQDFDETLTLTQSFRYGQAVADEANKVLAELGADFRLRGNPAMDSVVHDGDLDQADAVLVRTNAGAFSAAVAELGAGRRVAIQGGTEELASLIRAAQSLQAGQRTSHLDLMRFESWGQVVKEANEHPEDLGQLATFVKLVESYDHEDGIGRMLELLGQMDDADPDVVVCTAHKAKGLEWRRVRIGLDFTLPPEADLPEGQVDEDRVGELRLAYVAITRGRDEVVRGSLASIDELAAAPSAPSAQPQASSALEGAPSAALAPEGSQEPGEAAEPDQDRGSQGHLHTQAPGPLAHAQSTPVHSDGEQMNEVVRRALTTHVDNLASQAEEDQRFRSHVATITDLQGRLVQAGTVDPGTEAAALPFASQLAALRTRGEQRAHELRQEIDVELRKVRVDRTRVMELFSQVEAAVPASELSDADLARLRVSLEELLHQPTPTAEGPTVAKTPASETPRDDVEPELEDGEMLIEAHSVATGGSYPAYYLPSASPDQPGRIRMTRETLGQLRQVLSEADPDPFAAPEMPEWPRFPVVEGREDPAAVTGSRSGGLVWLDANDQGLITVPFGFDGLTDTDGRSLLHLPSLPEPTGPLPLPETAPQFDLEEMPYSSADWADQAVQAYTTQPETGVERLEQVSQITAQVSSLLQDGRWQHAEHVLQRALENATNPAEAQIWEREQWALSYAVRVAPGLLNTADEHALPHVLRAVHSQARLRLDHSHPTLHQGAFERQSLFPDTPAVLFAPWAMSTLEPILAVEQAGLPSVAADLYRTAAHQAANPGERNFWAAQHELIHVPVQYRHLLHQATQSPADSQEREQSVQALAQAVNTQLTLHRGLPDAGAPHPQEAALHALHAHMLQQALSEIAPEAAQATRTQVDQVREQHTFQPQPSWSQPAPAEHFERTPRLAAGEIPVQAHVAATRASYPAYYLPPKDLREQGRVRMTPEQLGHLVDHWKAAEGDPYGLPALPDWPRFGEGFNQQTGRREIDLDTPDGFVGLSPDEDGLITLPLSFDALTDAEGARVRPLPPLPATDRTLLPQAPDEEARRLHGLGAEELESIARNDEVGAGRLEQFIGLGRLTSSMVRSGAWHDMETLLESALESTPDQGEKALVERELWALRYGLAHATSITPAGTRHPALAQVVVAAQVLARDHLTHLRPSFQDSPYERADLYPHTRAGWPSLNSPHREIHRLEKAGLVVEAHRLYQEAYAAAPSPNERAYWQAQTELPYAPPEYRPLLNWALNTTAGTDDHYRASSALAQTLNDQYHNPIGPPEERSERLNQLYLALRTIDPEAAADVNPEILDRREELGASEDPIWLVPGPSVTEQRTTLQQLVPLAEHRAMALAQNGEPTRAIEALEHFRAHLGDSAEGAKVDSSSLRELYAKLSGAPAPTATADTPTPAPAARAENERAAHLAGATAAKTVSAPETAPPTRAASTPSAAATQPASAPHEPTVNKQDWQAATEAFQQAGRERQARNYSSALQHLAHAQRLDPTRAYHWEHATNVVRADQAAENAGHLMRKGKFQASLASLKQAQRLDPSREELWDMRRAQVNQARQNRPQEGSGTAKKAGTAKPRPKKPDPSAQRAASPSARSAQERRGQGR
ncbi:AAA family ATPase [Nocardiopsis sp. NPDC006198]|uniref:AAA family ATPase n=1 Tax=Nocardiopsis sp. NPDC006198 TaxID=3154472 RepID=UPI0033B76CEA